MWLTPSVKSHNNLANSDLENSDLKTSDLESSDLKKSDLETPYLEKSDLKTSYMYLENSDVNFPFEGKFCGFKSVLGCLFQFVKEL